LKERLVPYMMDRHFDAFSYGSSSFKVGKIL